MMSPTGLWILILERCSTWERAWCQDHTQGHLLEVLVLSETQRNLYSFLSWFQRNRA